MFIMDDESESNKTARTRCQRYMDAILSTTAVIMREHDGRELLFQCPFAPSRDSLTELCETDKKSNPHLILYGNSDIELTLRFRFEIKDGCSLCFTFHEVEDAKKIIPNIDATYADQIEVELMHYSFQARNRPLNQQVAARVMSQPRF